MGPLVPVRSFPGRRSLHSTSTGTNHLLVPPVKWSTVGSRAFPVAGPKTWNALPEDVTSSQSEYAFRRQLKTWLFTKSFPDIIIFWTSSSDTDCILTFSLGLSVPTLRWFCRLKTTIWYMIWYDMMYYIASVCECTETIIVDWTQVEWPKTGLEAWRSVSHCSGQLLPCRTRCRS